MGGINATKVRRFLVSLMALVLAYGAFALLQSFAFGAWEGLDTNEIENVHREHAQNRWIAISLLGIPMFWWHLADFAGRFEARSKFARLVGGYRLCASLLIYGLIGAAIMLSGALDGFQCPPTAPPPIVNGETEFGFMCTLDPTFGFEVLLALPALMLFAVACAKTIQAVVSWTRKTA